MKKLLLTLAALSGFFISQNANATCDISSSFTDGQILTAGQLNTLVTSTENCVNAIIDGENFTGNLNLYSGADLNVYSDAGTTLKYSIDGATGSFGTTSGQKLYLDGVSLAGNTYLNESSADVLSSTAGGNRNFQVTSSTVDVLSGADFSVAATKRLFLDGGTDTYFTESGANTVKLITGAAEKLEVSNSIFRILNNPLSVQATERIYLDDGGNTYFSEVLADKIVATTGGTSAMSFENTAVTVESGRTLFIPSHSTTASAANTYIDSVTGEIKRSTSSRKYKQDIIDLDVDSNLIYNLRPVTYYDKKETLLDGTLINDKEFKRRKYFGLIAEEVKEILPEMVDLNSLTGEPENVYYDRLSVLLLAEIKKIKASNDDIKARLTAAGL